MGTSERKSLKLNETIVIASMLFGMFFGAGNLIFPIHMGQLAGSNTVAAAIGFIITGVGLPLLAVASFGMSGTEDMLHLSSKISKGYGIFFTSLLTLSIGPFFAIPRCATTSFTVGIEPIVHSSNKIALLLFSLAFFAIVLVFSLKETALLTWIGKVINPLFLVVYGVLLIASFVKPIAPFTSIQPDASYASTSLLNGVLEGYNTMDALAGLLFGIVVIDAVKNFGVSGEKNIMRSTMLSGVYTCVLMAVIYMLSSIMGASSRGIFPISDNGGIALSEISHHYFGRFGATLLAAIVTLACLKTSIGLVASCSSLFVKIFSGLKLSRTAWVYIITIFSFVVANFGLNTIISFSIPVLMFIYPLTITLILLAIFGNIFKQDRIVYQCVTIFTLIPSIVDGLGSAPDSFKEVLNLNGFISAARGILPFANNGFGWVVPAIIGLVLGLILHFSKSKS